MSIFLAGGGLKMGQVVGATNARGEHPVERTMDSNCLLATIYRRFGIDTNQHYYDNSGRPVPILTDGEPKVVVSSPEFRVDRNAVRDSRHIDTWLEYGPDGDGSFEALGSGAGDHDDLVLEFSHSRLRRR